MRGQPWTTGQLRVLEEFGYLGVERVRGILLRRFGVNRTPAAIRKEASRLGVSLYAFAVCPKCGSPVKRLDTRTGVCRTCQLKNVRSDNAKRYARVRKQIAEKEEREAKDGQIQREINALRSATCRARRKL